MIKKGSRRIFIQFRNARIDLRLLMLFSVVMIAVMSWSSFADITVNLLRPSNGTYNGSRAMNFTFNVTAGITAEGTEGAQIVNCSVWTNITGTWAETKTNGTDGTASSNISNGSISWINFTLSSDNFIIWGVRCINATQSTLANTNGTTGNFSINNTLSIDTQAPVLFGVRPNNTFGAGWVNASGFYTSYGDMELRINISDNNTRAVWYTFNSIIGGAGVNESANRTMTAVQEANGIVMWNASFRNLLLFDSNFTGPGPHSVYFCANDSVGRISCSGPNDFAIVGMNVTQIEQQIAGMPQIGGGGFGGLNITYGNGTEIPYGEFVNPLGGVNLTFIFNFTPDIIIHIVGGRIDEKQFGNATQSKINSTPTQEVRDQVGSGMRGQIAWADIGSFIPSEVNYEYGIIQMGGINYQKKMYCNGTSMGAPLCHTISQCNSTAFGLFNHSIVIPTNDACWLDSTKDTVVLNGETKAAGFTFIFVDKFSGGVGGSDFGPVNATFNGPLYNGFNFSGQTKTRLINFSVNDINSTGINLTNNFTVNLTIYLDGTDVGHFRYINDSVTNLTCVPDDGGVFNNVASPGNSTIVTCNVTYTFQFNGTYILNVTSRDDSNNSNPLNVSNTTIKVILDDIPPVLGYFNITNSSTTFMNLSGDGNGGLDNETKTYDNTPGGSIRQGGIIYALANFTDNLTAPLEADLQFFNISTGLWSTLNTTGTTSNITPKQTNNDGWVNLTFLIPSEHDEFEGENVTFRIVANDTVGNRNTTTAGKGNITILINDTTVPRLRVYVDNQIDLNGTNISDTTPTIYWNVTDRSQFTYIAVHFDSLSLDACNQRKNLTTTASAASKTNGSMTLAEEPGCDPLGNGTHTVKLSAIDTWNNHAEYIYQFYLETGVPNITLTALSNGMSAVNQSNVTPYTGLNFTVVDGATGNIKNFTWVSSCNGTVQAVIGNATVINNSMIWPFNYTGCQGVEANQTVNVTVIDVSGNTLSKVYQFLVDEVGPSLAVHAPTNDFSGTSNLTINLSAQDGNQRISFFGYYLDTSDLAVILNATENLDGAGANISLLNNTNFSTGKHNIKFTVNDTLGNRKNSSIISFTAVGPVLGKDMNVSLSNYLGIINNNITNVTFMIKDSSGNYNPLSGANDTNNTYQIVITVTQGAQNVSNITLSDINGSGANWAAINFTLFLNQTDTQQGLQNNWTATVLSMVHFNDSINEFLPNYNDYYGSVTLEFNLSGTTATAQQIWWVGNSSNLTTRTNVSQCTGGYSATSTVPCWNYTDGGRTLVLVPHFSDVVVVNDTSPPTLTINNPQTPQRIISFVPNITVSSDALNCSYTYNMSGGAVTERITMTLEVLGDGTHICSGPRINNLTNNLSINFSFYVYDTSYNLNQTSNYTLINDTTTPEATTITESSLSSTGITVAITSNETVNMSINSTGSNSFTNPTAVATFTQSPSITISGLTASTIYNYTVLICDRASNCLLNTTLGFTTSAAETATTTTTTTSGGGGGGGAAPVASNVVSSTAKIWSSITPDAPAKITIAKVQIAVNEISIEVGTTVSNVELKVESLKSNPKKAEPASKVYQYIEITKSNLANADIKKANINFKVAKSWLSKNGVGESDVALYRYADNTWNQLKTTKIGDDANNVLYQAETPGFSTFAIGTRTAPAEKPAEIAPTQPTAPTGEVTAPTPAPKAEEKVTVPEAPAPTKGRGTTVAVVIVAIVLAALLVGYWYKKKGSK